MPFDTYIEAISAIEVMTKPIPTAVPRNVKIAPPGPPFVKGIMRVLLADQTSSGHEAF
jgi:hypothetical protein